MPADAWWSWIVLVAMFGSPWILAIVRLCRRGIRDLGTPPSAAELARRRLWTS